MSDISGRHPRTPSCPREKSPPPAPLPRRRTARAALGRCAIVIMGGTDPARAPRLGRVRRYGLPVRLRGLIGGLLRLPAYPCSARPETRCASVRHTGRRPLHASLAPSSGLIAVSRHHWPASANTVAPWIEIPPPARCPILSRPPWSSRFAPLLHPALRPSPSRGATRLIARRPRAWLGVPPRASARSAP